MAKIVSLEMLSKNIGQEIGESNWFLIDQERVNAFAACTNDNQWIHTNKERAALGPFGDTIVHGFLLFALIPYFNQEVYSLPPSIKMTINYGINRARFLRPVLVGSEIKDSIFIKKITDKGGGKILLETEHNIRVKTENNPVFVADMLRMLITI
jgi:acyl dehydratase